MLNTLNLASDYDTPPNSSIKSKAAIFPKSLTTPDDLKFHSCMTLFALAVPDDPDFTFALEKYFDGEEDARTIELLESGK